MNINQINKAQGLMKEAKKINQSIIEIEQAAIQIAENGRSVSLNFSYDKTPDPLVVDEPKIQNTWNPRGIGTYSFQQFFHDELERASLSSKKNNQSKALINMKLKDTESLEVLGILMSKRMSQLNSILTKLVKMGFEIDMQQLKNY